MKPFSILDLSTYQPIKYPSMAPSSEALNFHSSYSIGKDLSVNEDHPEVGQIRSSFYPSSQVNDQLTINPSLRYSQLKRLNGGEDYFVVASLD